MTDFFRENNPFAKSNDEIYRHICETFASGDRLRFTMAKQNRLSVFPWDCPTHGETPFSVKHGTCDACRKSKRSEARRTKQTHYLDNCEKHGETRHRVDTGNCQACRDETPRGKKATLRSLARREGKQSYLEVCRAHGVTAHGVQSGKCLSCFNAMGAPRPGPPEPPTARQAARRRGASAYNAPCDRHGPAVPHSVASGKCLSCFTVKGAPRARA